MSRDTDALSLTLPKRSKSRRRFRRPPKNVVIWVLMCLLAGSFLAWDLLSGYYVGAAISAFYLAVFHKNIVRGLEGDGPTNVPLAVVLGILGTQIALEAVGVK